MIQHSKTLELTATAYRGQGRRLPLWIGGGVLLTVAANALLLTSLSPSALVVLGSFGALLPLVLLVLGARERKVTLRAEGNHIDVNAKRNAWQGNVQRAEVVPWILAGVGTVQGGVLLLHASDAHGKARVLAMAAAGFPISATPRGSMGHSDPDLFVTAPELSQLLAHFGLHSEPDGAVVSSEQRFVLVRREGIGGALRGASTWFLCMATLGILGSVFGERLASSSLGLGLFGVGAAALIAFAVYRTMRSAQRDKPRFEFVIRPGALTLCDEIGTPVWSLSSPPFPVARETYVYRTRYGSHNFATLKIGPKGRELRVAAWDPRFARPTDPKGAAPEYLIGVPDWQRFETALTKL